LDIDPSAWQGKRVLVTGHTGFKGSWLVLLLNELGAEVIGLSLPPPDFGHSLYRDARIQSLLTDEYFIDIRDEELINKTLQNSSIDYAFHLAAQAFVKRSLKNPLESITTNISGTANVLLSLLKLNSIQGITVVTSDKVYQNLEKGIPFNEVDRLGSKDPYSASKAAVELITNSLSSTCNPFNIPVTTARAGNVLGGGDWGEDRLVPDLVKAMTSNQSLLIRNPNASRPWQHVLDCLRGYLLLGQSHLNKDIDTPISINFGPSESLSVIELIRIFELSFKKKINYEIIKSNNYESIWLELDSKLAKDYLGWQTLLSPEDAINQTADWYLKFANGADSKQLMEQEITNYRLGKW
jgi:CDP-glucose 4,6-dehydratase